MIYYLTGKENSNEFKVEFNGQCGSSLNSYGILRKSIYLKGNIPLVSINYELVERSGNLYLIVNYSGGTITLSVNISNSIVNISGYVKASFTAQELIYLEDLNYIFYDDVGNIDYPTPQRMNIKEKIKDYVNIEVVLNSNSQTASVYSPNTIIENYNAYFERNSGVSAILNPNSNVNISISNTFRVSTSLNNTKFYPNTLYDSETRTYNIYGLYVSESSQINSTNDLTETTSLQIIGTVPAEENEFYAMCTFSGTHNPIKSAIVKLKAYNLDKPNSDIIPISIFGDYATFTSEFNKEYRQLYKYSYTYYLITRGGSFYNTNPNYDVAKVSSDYRFMFRTFLYDAITSLRFNDTKPYGNYLNINSYQVIKEAQVDIVDNDVQIKVYFEGGGLFPSSENPGNSIVRYIPNNGDFLYSDSYRYLRLKLKKYLAENVAFIFKVKCGTYEKEYRLNAYIPDFYNPTIFYIDLCNPYNATQSIDDKNNNFDEDDSYADYWGVTKSLYIDIYFNNSFVLSGIDLCKKRDDISNGEEKITILPQKSTWQENKRRNVVSRFYGKQNLELSDVNKITGMYTIDDLANEINSTRWYGWECTKAVYDLSSCSGTFRNLRPCLLNLYTPATFLAGAGNTFNGSLDKNYVNIDFTNNMQINAQFLVDEISFYPNCGDVFWGTNTNGAILLYASLIKRAQANGLIFVYNELVKMYNDNHYAGEDLSDEYGYYYISGEYAKVNNYKVEYNIFHVLECHDANEYRVCFKPVLATEININDINYERGTFLATTKFNDNNSLVFFFDNNFDRFTKKNIDCSSCDIKKQLLLTAGSKLMSYTYNIMTNKELMQLSNAMFPFVKVYNNEIYVSYYDEQNKNFIFEIYDGKYNLKSRYTNIIKTVPSGGEIKMQNFPFDINGGLIIGIFFYVISNDKYIQVVHSIDGEKWYKVLEEQI